MERTIEPDKSMREPANQRYLDSHGITADMVSAHELVRDPPPYQSQSVREATFFPEAPSPAPITGQGVVMDPDVVMGDFLDDRIDELEKKLNECNGKLKLYEVDDDLFEDVQEEEPEEMKKPSQPMKKFDYKTKGRVIIRNIRFMTLKRAIENFEGVKAIQLYRDPETFSWLEKERKINSPYSDSSYFFRQLNSDENLYKRGKINRETSGVMYIVIFETKEILDGFLKYYFVPPQLQDGGAKKGRGRKSNIFYGKNEFSKLRDEINDEIKDGRRKNPDWNKRGRDYRWANFGREVTRLRSMIDSFNNVFTDLNLESGIPISTIKKIYKQNTITIEFEDENDKREVEAMQGGGYRRRNPSRKSRKRNTRRKSRKSNTRRKSRKRNTRRKSRKKKTRRKSKRGGGITSQEIRDKRKKLRKIGEIGRYSYGPEMERLSHLQSFDDRIDFRSHNNLIRRINNCEGSKKELISELDEIIKSLVGAHYI